MTAPTSGNVDVHDGLFPVVTDTASGIVYLGVREFGVPFLLTGGLITGLGASTVPLDRGFPGTIRTAQFVRNGTSAYLELLSRDFGAGRPTGGSAQQAVDNSFARSVVFAAPLTTAAELRARLSIESALPAPHFIDVTALVASDVHGFDASFAAVPGPKRFESNSAVHYVHEPALSYAHPEQSRAFPRNSELTGTITFRPTGEIPPAVAAVVPDSRHVTVSQRISFLALPTGFQPRAYHPSSGGYGKGFDDPTLVGQQLVHPMYQPRFRLDPTGALDRQGRREVAEPITFFVDSGVPEPYLAAIVEGGNWWQSAFEAAGFAGAYQVAVLPDGVDPWAASSNVVWWVHRSGRGWSMGHSVTDPYTGEILRGSVRLGSQRITQLRLIFEGLLSPYGRPDEAERLAAIERALLQRIRQLAAHEIGHALGFMHNFASTWHDKPSVMDYPHPFIGIGSDGELDLSEAYPTGLGPWDEFLVRHGYGTAPDGVDEAEFLHRLRVSVSALDYLSDVDGRADSASSPRAVPWTIRKTDQSPDVFAALEHILRVREKALADFGPGAAPGGAQAGELESRLTAVYLLHRFQLQAVARLVGGEDYDYSQLEDGRTGTRITNDELQFRALRTVAALIRRRTTDLPESVWAALTPPGIRYDRGADTFHTRLGNIFDSVAATEAAIGLVVEELLAPTRLNRAQQQRLRGRHVPDVTDILAALQEELAAAAPGADRVVLRYALAALASNELTPAVAAGLLEALDRWAQAGDGAFAALARNGVTAAGAGALANSPAYRLPYIPLGIPL